MTDEPKGPDRPTLREGLASARSNRRFTAVMVVVCLMIGGVAAVVGEELIEGEENEGGPGSVPYEPAIRPEDFTTTIDNPYLPMAPGTRWVYSGKTGDGTERIEVVVTNSTRVVMGVTCVVVRDTVRVDGKLVEDTYDWFAQDSQGNVWYFGEESKEYEDGKLVSTGGSWEAGVDGARPGILMLAHPLVGLSYRQEYLRGEAEDKAMVVALDESVTVPQGSYTGVLRTREWTPLEPGVGEDKFYASGVGCILEVSVSGKERVELVEFHTE